jgi:hypothetical protein
MGFRGSRVQIPPSRLLTQASPAITLAVLLCFYGRTRYGTRFSLSRRDTLGDFPRLGGVRKARTRVGARARTRSCETTPASWNWLALHITAAQ